MNSNIIEGLEIKNLDSFILKGNFRELSNCIEELIENNGEEILHLINRIMSHPFYLAQIIRLIQQDKEYFQKVLKESYYHENGFHKIVLVAGRNFKIRLHHFGDTARIPMENIHDHRWPFVSSILKGTLRMQMLEHSKEAGEEFIHYLYSSDKAMGKYGLDLIGKKKLAVSHEYVYHCGDQYIMRTNELHRIINTEGEDSITIIVTGKPIKDTCNLYANRPIEESEQETRPYTEIAMKEMLDYISGSIYPQRN